MHSFALDNARALGASRTLATTADAIASVQADVGEREDQDRGESRKLLALRRDQSDAFPPSIGPTPCQKPSSPGLNMA
jgi:hypothetical protein